MHKAWISRFEGAAKLDGNNSAALIGSTVLHKLCVAQMQKANMCYAILTLILYREIYKLS